MGLFGGKSQETRIPILETVYMDFQEKMVEHMRSEELSFGEVKDTLKEIVAHIDSAQKDNEKSLIQHEV